jgi:hypothetical protein
MTRLPSFRLLPVLLGFAAALVIAAPAMADGDPASDYLLTQSLFVPFAPTKVSDSAQNSLRELLASSKDKGYEVRVALIATRTDLGAVPVLYRQPQRYADFLGQELVYFWKGPTLVVMPNGYGIFQNGKKLTEDKAVLAKLAPPSSADGDTLAASGEKAVRALADRRGITLPSATAADKSSSSNRDRVVLAGGVILLCLVALGARLLLGRRRGAKAA